MFSIVIPLFNEEENIEPLFREIVLNLNHYNDYEIILVDDASTDNTLKKINNVINKKTKVIRNLKNQGQSYSILNGIQNSSNKIIITLDGDGQNDPADIPKLLEYYLSYKDIELVAGIRFKRQDSLIKKISSRLANYIRSKILKDNCLDTGCSLKVFNKDIFLEFPFFNGIHRFLPALFIGFGYKAAYINVNHRKRNFGISKYGTMNRLFKGIKDIIRVNNILKKRIK